MRNAGKIDSLVERDDATCCSIEEVVKSISINRILVGDAIFVAVLQKANSVGSISQFCDGIPVIPFLVKFLSVV